jgi:hypothetical protein
MSTFNIENFKQYVESKIINYSNKLILDAVCQFEKPSHVIANLSQQYFSKLINKMFDLSSKPRTVSVNDWFLIKFGFKKCSKCGNIKVLDNFYNCSTYWHGKEVKCKDCCLLMTDDEKIQKYENVKIWRKKNPDKCLAQSNKRRGLKANAITSNYCKHDEEKAYWLVYFLQKELNICLHLDHIKSLSKGGAHDRYNWQILTKEDNLRKYNNDYSIVKPIIANEKLQWFMDSVL